MRYHRSLDGLRALSALAVLAENAGYGHARGGFVGVDVFFALSGYLITASLLVEVERHGRVRFGRFFARRARRLLPALCAMLLLAWILWPADGPPLRPNALATLGYYANWRAARYGARAMGPLAHTWSLSVEEQFYLLWPFTFALLMLGSRRRAALGTAMLVASLALTRTFLIGTPLATYPSTLARMDEILIGACVALLQPRVVPRWLVLAGSGLILGVLLLAHGNQRWLYRGGFSLIALSAALLVHFLVLQPGDPLARLLGWTPLVELGRRSYGFYLYQLPIIVWLERYRIHHDLGNAIVISLLRLGIPAALAWLSLRFVERPFLRGFPQEHTETVRAGAT
jgi:peptidoglycan/LPS O-acetylase OafA/YrhL